MKCEVEYCIYNRNYECICGVIQLNSAGMCEACILINLDKDFMEAEKERQLREIEARWKKDTN